MPHSPALRPRPPPPRSAKRCWSRRAHSIFHRRRPRHHGSGQRWPTRQGPDGTAGSKEAGRRRRTSIQTALRAPAATSVQRRRWSFRLRQLQMSCSTPVRWGIQVWAPSATFPRHWSRSAARPGRRPADSCPRRRFEANSSRWSRRHRSQRGRSDLGWRPWRSSTTPSAGPSGTCPLRIPPN